MPANTHPPSRGQPSLQPPALDKSLKDIRSRGYLERDSLQTYGLVDISCPILGPDKHALPALTCSYLRRIDRHVGPNLQEVRTLLLKTTRALSLLSFSNPAHPR